MTSRIIGTPCTRMNGFGTVKPTSAKRLPRPAMGTTMFSTSAPYDLGSITKCLSPATDGDFTTTSLDYNTIRVTGTDANDTVNISGLESAHRVVFTTNGGSDTMLGALRNQDIIDGSVIDQRSTSVAAPMAAAAVTSASFGAFDGLDALVRSGLRGSLLDQSFGAADGLLRGAPGRVEFRTLGLDDLNIFSREAVDFTPMQQSVGRTMIDTHDLMPLDLADFGPAQGVDVGSVHVDLTPFDYRSITADMWVLP